MQSRALFIAKRIFTPVIVLIVAASILSSCSNSKAALPRVVGKPDQLCNGGRGLYLTTSYGVIGSGATTSSTTGLRLQPGNIVQTSSDRTLLSFNAMDAADNSGPVRIVAVNSNCTIDRLFGNHGVLDPSTSGASAPLESFGLAQGRKGNFFVIGSRGEGWLIGEFTPNGTVDDNFGDRGWVVITPPRGAVGFSASISDVQVTSSGEILILGDNAESHADVQPYLYELNPNGSINASFGDVGYVSLFSPFVYAQSLLLQPDGAIVATGSYGGAGCYSMPFEWLSSSGYVQSSIDTNFNASQPVAVASQVFWGSIFLDSRGGVGIVGLSSSCNGIRSDVTSKIQEFNPDGTPLRSFGIRGTVRISTPNPNDFDFSAVALPNQDLVVQSYANESSQIVNIRDFLPNGHMVADFGHVGLMTLKIPSLLTNFTAPSDVVIVSRGDVGVLLPSNTGLTFEEFVG